MRKRRKVFQKLGVKEIERQQAIQMIKFKEMLEKNTIVEIDEPCTESDTNPEIVAK